MRAVGLRFRRPAARVPHRPFASACASRNHDAESRRSLKLRREHRETRFRHHYSAFGSSRVESSRPDQYQVLRLGRRHPEQPSMLSPRMDAHHTLASEVDLLEDLASRLLLQPGWHGAVAPQGAEVRQVCPNRLKGPRSGSRLRAIGRSTARQLRVKASRLIRPAARSAWSAARRSSRAYDRPHLLGSP